MLTRVLVVQPLFSVILDESGQVADTAQPNRSAPRVGEPVAANGAILQALVSLIQKAAAELPTLLPMIISIIGLFGQSQPTDSTPQGTGGEKVGANGAILNALANLLQMACTELPAIMPEILQLIALFGGKTQVVPTPSDN